MNDQDVNYKVTHDALKPLLTAYIKRLVEKVGFQVTVVAPSEPLPLESIYEQLFLKKFSDAAVVLEEEVTRPGAKTYIVDNAGMGKSTFAKHLVLEQIKNAYRIPVFIELRKLNPALSIVDAVAEELDSFSATFDRMVFQRLLTTNRFFIVLDGFDEIIKENRDSRAREIEQLLVKGDQCTLVITSRPGLNLPLTKNVLVATFVPLSRMQVVSLIDRYDKAKNKSFKQHLVSKLNRVPKRFLRNPLLVALLYRTYEYNGSISNGIATFYDELFNALFKSHDSSKDGYERVKQSDLDYESFRWLVRSLSITMMVNQVSA